MLNLSQQGKGNIWLFFSLLLISFPCIIITKTFLSEKKWINDKEVTNSQIIQIKPRILLFKVKVLFL